MIFYVTMGSLGLPTNLKRLNTTCQWGYLDLAFSCSVPWDNESTNPNYWEEMIGNEFQSYWPNMARLRLEEKSEKFWNRTTLKSFYKVTLESDGK